MQYKGDIMTKIKSGFAAFLTRLREMNKKHFIACFLVLLSLVLAIYKYELSYVRFLQNVSDLWNSIIFYICKKFLKIEGMEEVITITDIHNIDLNKIVPFDLNTFLDKWSLYSEYLASFKNFKNYCMFVLTYGSLGVSILSILLPIVILSMVLIKKSYLSPGKVEDKYKDTK